MKKKKISKKESNKIIFNKLIFYLFIYQIKYYKPIAVYVTVIRDIYEAFLLFTFFYLIHSYLAFDEDTVNKKKKINYSF
jgi:hypothetical protein